MSIQPPENILVPAHKGVFTHSVLAPLAAVLHCRLQQLQAARCPFSAAQVVTSTFHSHPCSRAHFNTSRCPPSAANVATSESHLQPLPVCQWAPWEGSFLQLIYIRQMAGRTGCDRPFGGNHQARHPHICIVSPGGCAALVPHCENPREPRGSGAPRSAVDLMSSSPPAPAPGGGPQPSPSLAGPSLGSQMLTSEQCSSLFTSNISVPLLSFLLVETRTQTLSTTSSTHDSRARVTSPDTQHSSEPPLLQLYGSATLDMASTPAGPSFLVGLSVLLLLQDLHSPAVRVGPAGRVFRTRNKHSTDVTFPAPPPRVCMGVWALTVKVSHAPISVACTCSMTL